jgi:hypothetical protein
VSNEVLIGDACGHGVARDVHVRFVVIEPANADEVVPARVVAALDERLPRNLARSHNSRLDRIQLCVRQRFIDHEVRMTRRSAVRQLWAAVISPWSAPVLAGKYRQPTDDDQCGHRAGDEPEQRQPRHSHRPNRNGRSALPADEGVAQGFPHDLCASSNLTHEAPALPHVCRLAQRLDQWSDFRGDPLPDERCRIHERKHGISIAPVVRIGPERQIWCVSRSLLSASEVASAGGSAGSLSVVAGRH